MYAFPTAYPSVTRVSEWSESSCEHTVTASDKQRSSDRQTSKKALARYPTHLRGTHEHGRSHRANTSKYDNWAGGACFWSTANGAISPHEDWGNSLNPNSFQVQVIFSFHF